MNRFKIYQLKDLPDELAEKVEAVHELSARICLEFIKFHGVNKSLAITTAMLNKLLYIYYSEDPVDDTDPFVDALCESIKLNLKDKLGKIGE